MNTEDLNNLTVNEVLQRIEEGGKESLSLLKAIEINTSRMKSATTAMQKQAVTTSRVQAKRSAVELKTTIKNGKVIADAVAKDLRQRDNRGRFIPRQGRTLPSPKTVDESSDTVVHDTKGTTLFDILRRGAASQWGEKGAGVKDIAGRAALGPLWDLGGEVKEAVQAMKEKSGQGTAAEVKAWAKLKFGKTKDGSVRYQQATPPPKPDKRKAFAEKAQRVREARQQTQIAATPAAGGGDSIVGNAVGTAAGGFLGRIFGPLVRAIEPIVVAAAPVVAILGSLAVGFAAIMAVINKGKDNGRNDKLTPEQMKAINPIAPTAAEKAGWSNGVYKPKGNVVFADGSTTTVKNSDGSLTERRGTRGARNNNPGNIEYGEFARSMGATGSDGRFAVFPDKATGDKAREKLFFEGKNYKDLTVSQAVEQWAPADKNPLTASGEYQRRLIKAAGGEDKKVSEYTPKQRKAIMAAMQNIEGNRLDSTKVIPAKDVNAYLTERGIGEKPVATANSAEYVKSKSQSIVTEQSIIDAVPSAPSINTKGRDTYVPTVQATPQYRRRPEPQVIQQETPTVKGMDKLLDTVQKSQEAQQKPQASNRSDKEQVALLPHIPTDFSDVQLVLMAYDRV